MILEPKNAEELSAYFKGTAHAAQPINRVDLRFMQLVTHYAPEDMTITAQLGLSLSSLQKVVGQNRQWLPLDPYTNDLTLHDLISKNVSGPRRLGYGTVRDYLLGLQAVTGDGEIIRSGGRVVKNVAGYDLLKLFVGSGISLGVATEATIMLRPLPESTSIFSRRVETLESADRFIEMILKSEVRPVALDLYNLNGHLELRVCLEGFREDVEAQGKLLQEFGPFQPDTFEAETNFFNQVPAPNTVSVLPSKTCETLVSLTNCRFVARAGNGVIHHEGTPMPKAAKSPAVRMLSERLKKTFDPHSFLPSMAS